MNEEQTLIIMACLCMELGSVWVSLRFYHLGLWGEALHIKARSIELCKIRTPALNEHAKLLMLHVCACGSRVWCLVYFFVYIFKLIQEQMCCTLAAEPSLVFLTVCVA